MLLAGASRGPLAEGSRDRSRIPARQNGIEPIRQLRVNLHMAGAFLVELEPDGATIQVMPYPKAALHEIQGLAGRPRQGLLAPHETRQHSAEVVDIAAAARVDEVQHVEQATEDHLLAEPFRAVGDMLARQGTEHPIYLLGEELGPLKQQLLQGGPNRGLLERRGLVAADLVIPLIAPISRHHVEHISQRQRSLPHVRIQRRHGTLDIEQP